MNDGGTDLERLIAEMNPVLRDGVYVFTQLAPGAPEPEGINPLMQYAEAEGISLVLLENEALGVGLQASFRSRLITLTVHSSLSATGFLAALLPPLAQAGIAVNVVSAFMHDHLFVPVERADEAMDILRGLSEACRPKPS